MCPGPPEARGGRVRRILSPSLFLRRPGRGFVSPRDERPPGGFGKTTRRYRRRKDGPVCRKVLFVVEESEETVVYTGTSFPIPRRSFDFTGHRREPQRRNRGEGRTTDFTPTAVEAGAPTPYRNICP